MTSKKTEHSAKKKTGKKPSGRPSVFKKEYCKIAYVISRKGLTDKELAEAFGISERTLYNWKDEHADFLQAIKKGKDEHDTCEVENALLKSAKGFEYTEDQVIKFANGKFKIVKTKKYQPPNPTSCIYWLNNRNPKRWSNKQQIEHSGESPELKINVLQVPMQMDKEQWLEVAKTQQETLAKIEKSDKV